MEDDGLYVESLAAAEAMVRGGRFNAAKVLRALAHAQRTEALQQARAAAAPLDVIDLLRRHRAALTGSAARGIAERAISALADHPDVPEDVVAPFVWGCYGCGHLAEGERPDTCPQCGALAVEFEWFGPFYAANPEHLGQHAPDGVLEILRRTPDDVAEVLRGRDDAELAMRPAPDEWSTKELVGHLVETDGLFRARLRGILSEQGVPVLDARLPWTLHEGKDYDRVPAEQLLARFIEGRGETVALVEGLLPQDWMRKGTVRGTANSVLDLGTWLANHDVGHLAQARRPRD